MYRSKSSSQHNRVDVRIDAKIYCIFFCIVYTNSVYRLVDGPQFSYNILVGCERHDVLHSCDMNVPLILVHNLT